MVPGRSEMVQLPKTSSCPNAFVGMAWGEMGSVLRLILVIEGPSSPHSGPPEFHQPGNAQLTFLGLYFLLDAIENRVD